MDLDEPETMGWNEYPDESSGSAYEISDDEESHDEDDEELPALRGGSERGRKAIKSHSKKDGKNTPNLEVREDAAGWASSFQAPKAEDIKAPRRQSRGGKKRRAPKLATESRIKRLKSFYSNQYRELLNCEIQDAASSVADSDGLKESQIGSSIWTAAEKGILFNALQSLGRDNVPGIAERIGSKSQHQVQEYVNLMLEGVMKRKEKYYQLVAPTDYPTAVEISDECCAILERAGDALAAHQELAEEKVEKAKWGDTWLINEDVALQIEKKRKQSSDEEEMEEVLPAAVLLNLNTWMELADRIFMNPGFPREEDNWQAIAEPGEEPAVRATAFEDFHSLAYNVTKRLVSTALFCSMSRQRAKGSNKVKHAEVNTNDVEAAVNILGLKADSHEYWMGVAKRCSLQVIDDDYDEALDMTYKEVERALRERHPRTRSRSMSRARSQSRVRSEPPERIAVNSEKSQHTDSEDDEAHTDSESESEHESIVQSEEEFMSSPPPSDSSTSDSEPTPVAVHPKSHPKPNSPTRQQSPEGAQDVHTEAHDMYTSQTEEIRLWNLLGQVPPFDFTLSPVQEKAPKSVRDVLVDRENWRDYVGYLNEWETMDSPVLREEFERNRRKSERKARRKAAKALEEDSGDGSIEYQVGEEDAQQDGSNDEVEVQHELLQVESPRQHSPEYQSSDPESEASHGDGSVRSENEEMEEEQIRSE
ncbi:hypothetical protein ONS95_001090 [Cadophora gregata]|uniref:uncharacterized protein n=1 Tax=Cadophora gregata TaxID=51156 RepID=UPI0026DDB619|nr:uncharacterized protein ONS95_001090 [Cadophora gregata]KAK0102108.1 hypothetical protein ONS96_006073 [Cadophora gregata f. sp. sojae]KAK0129157.1 hypothetical protein ONS95_001090 [Cadophora gregata]